jgi:hypothetical protein
LVLLGYGSRSVQEQFAKYKGEESNLTSGDQCIDGPTVEQQDRQVRHEELITEELVVMDEAIPSEPEEAGLSCIPAAFDSHFHLDRTSKAIWGHDKGHTVEDLLAISTHGPMVSQLTVPVRVVSGIVVYCDPKTYPDNSFSWQAPWRVAVGVHPKQYRNYTLEAAMKLQRLLENPLVVALGELID